MSDQTDSRGLLEAVAQASRLSEGSEGVRRVIRSVLRNGPVPIRDVARDVSLPVPVVAAVRGELEKRGILTRKGGLALTPDGERRVRDEVGLSSRISLYRQVDFRMPDVLRPALEAFETIASSRPEVDVRLDQSHALPETAIKRAAYLHEHDALEGRRILVLGDDDLTSVALCLVGSAVGTLPDGIAVCEVDPRLCGFIREIARERDWPIETTVVDLREGLPAPWVGESDVFFTDPPYTLNGLSLFASRGLEGLKPEVGKQAYVSFGPRRPSEAAEAVRGLAAAGLAPMEIVPDFNRYVGAQLLAGSSQMMRLVTCEATHPPVPGRYEDPIYTADRRRKSP